MVFLGFLPEGNDIGKKKALFIFLFKRLQGRIGYQYEPWEIA